MHCLDTLVISSCELICCENIFGVVVVNFQQTVIFSLFCFQAVKLLRDLNIELFILLCRYKINLPAAELAHMNGVTPAAEFQIHNIFKAGSHTILIISQNAVSQSSICKIEFLLRFQDFLSLQIVTGTTMQQVCLLQFFQIIVDRFIVKRTVLCFQIIRDGLRRKGVADIVKGVFYNIYSVPSGKSRFRMTSYESWNLSHTNPHQSPTPMNSQLFPIP